MISRVLITGINGYIGQYLTFTKPPGIELIGTVHNTQAQANPILTEIPLINFDIRQEPDQYLKNINPELLIHTAAIANLAECERNPDQAAEINTEATKRLAQWCAENGVRMVYLSTDIVFSGQNPPYQESSKPDPINVYGRSKLAGEIAVSNQTNNYVILRIALALGRGLWNRQNFIDWFLTHLEAEKEIPLFDDEIRTPAPVLSLVNLIWKIAGSNETGVFHICSSKRINRFELGRAICNKLGLGLDLIRPVKSADLKGYPRPLDVPLLSTRLFDGEDLTLPAIDESLDSILKKYI